MNGKFKLRVFLLAKRVASIKVTLLEGYTSFVFSAFCNPFPSSTSSLVFASQEAPDVLSNTVSPNQINSFVCALNSKSCWEIVFPLSSADDADSYRDRLKVLRMRAGLDNGANTESKVRVHLYTMCSIRQIVWIFTFFYWIHLQCRKRKGKTSVSLDMEKILPQMIRGSQRQTKGLPTQIS